MTPLAVISVEGAGGQKLAELLSKNKKIKYFGNIYSRKAKGEWYEWIKTQVYQDSDIHYKKDRLDLQSAFMTTLFLRTDVVNKSIPLVYIDHMDLDEYHEVLDLFKMGKFRVIHFRRHNLVNVMGNNSKNPIIINIQDTIRKMMLIEKQQELLKKELLSRDIKVLDVTYEEYESMWKRIADFLELKKIHYKLWEEPDNHDKIKNWDDFKKALQYTQFAHMV